MAYQALYRTYRPQQFSQMAGQQHITTILKNQVRENQFSHAYLFCGSRGTGKTTAARILARAINCLDPKEGEPCGACPNCRLAAGQNGDIIEIDAASNNGVDNVRDLISQAQFAPLQLKYRVFIIDEVHMLSGPAFNALLKTLEEPPAHVVFIMATTEPQKLPATIISRCQRFDFHRLSVPEIISYLQFVLQSAGAAMEPDGLRLIARAAEGGMRDALSLLDQCLSSCGNEILARDVENVLGTTGEDALFDMGEHLLGGNARAALLALNELIRRGKDLTVFAGELAGHFRSLLLVKACGASEELLSCTADTLARYEKQAQKYPGPRLLYAMEQLSRAQNDMRYFPSPRMLMETVLVRIAQPEEDRDVLALAARVSLLEQKLANIQEKGLAAPAPRVPEPPVYAPDDYLPEPPPEEYYPPLPEEPAAPAPKPEPKPAPKPAPRPAPKAEPEPVQPSAPAAAADGSADSVWKQVLQNLLHINAMVHKFAAYGQGTALQDGLLTVSFLPEYKGKMGMLTNKMAQDALQQAAQAVQPGLQLSIIESSQGNDAADLVGLFKDKLTIS